MEALSHAQYAGETEREREREKKTENYIPKNSNSILFNVHVCVFNAHFYTSPLED